VARTVQPAQSNNDDDESLVRVFFRGFFWPLRMVFKGLAWITHRPPLKQIGHALRWFFRLRAVRFIGRMLGFGYFRSSWQELRQVTWPARREGRRLTTAVIIFSVVFGALIAVVDFGLDKLFRQVLLK
jgi:preprotein translocase SecE subunit